MKESRIPSQSECLELMAEVDLASAVVRHSVAVKNIALGFAEDLEKQGVLVNKPLLCAAALLHDIMKTGAQVCHGIEGGEFLRSKGFHEVASVVEKHCLSNLDDLRFIPKTIEEKLLMYADLRISEGSTVSLDERFSQLKKRYKPTNPENFKRYLNFARQLEINLFKKNKET